jgi:hypothetical protein
MVFIYGSAVLMQPEAEFMKVSGHSLESSQTWSFRIYITNQFQTTFAQKEENSQLRLRIRPLVTEEILV